MCYFWVKCSEGKHCNLEKKRNQKEAIEMGLARLDEF